MGLVLILAPVGADGRASAAESATRPAESGQSAGPNLRALDHFLLGQTAWEMRDHERAVAEWETAAALDRSALPPRLALIRAGLLHHPSLAAIYARETADLALTDFRTQRWLARNAVLALAIGGTLAAILFMAGLAARHLRGIHHVLAETVEWHLRPGPAAGWLAAAIILLPVLARLGLLCLLLFWLYVCAFRLERAERIGALVAAAWVLLLGPALVAGRSWWSVAPDGRDGLLIYETQQEPASVPSRAAIEDWQRADPASAAACFLDGLALLEERDARAIRALSPETAAVGIPPAVIESNLGTLDFRGGLPDRARAHYERALAFDSNSFEAEYNLGILLASEARYTEADAAIARAAKIDLGRLRSLERERDGPTPPAPIPALCSASDLWHWDFRHPARAVPPRILDSLFPGGSPAFTPPAALISILLGILAAYRIGRVLRIRPCVYCGGPLCRRCQVWIGRQAVCRSCGTRIAEKGPAPSPRNLRLRLLGDRPATSRWAARILPGIAPGAGAAYCGHAAAGGAAAVLGGLAGAFWTLPSWSLPALPVARDVGTIGLSHAVAVGLLGMSLIVNAWGVHAAERRVEALRSFLAAEGVDFRREAA